MYMVAMAYAFERGRLSVGHLLAVKPLADRPGDRPWTRRYLYPIEDRGGPDRMASQRQCRPRSEPQLGADLPCDPGVTLLPSKGGACCQEAPLDDSAETVILRRT